MSFADPTFSDSTSLATLPDGEQPPTSARVVDLAHNPHNRRDTYDDDAMSDLVASLREVGQLQPATVVGREVFLAHYPDDGAALGDARWVVLLGNRRLHAARLAGMERLDIVVRDHLGGSDPRLSEAMLVENLHRAAFPPLLEARELQALVERHGGQAQAGQRIGKSQGWVSQRIGLLRLGPDLQALLSAGEMTIREARQVAAIDPADQLAALGQLRNPEPPPPTVPDPEPESAPETTAPDERSPVDTDMSTGRPGSAPGPDVERIARDLHRRLDDDQRARLVALLSAPPGITG